MTADAIGAASIREVVFSLCGNGAILRVIRGARGATIAMVSGWTEAVARSLSPDVAEMLGQGLDIPRDRRSIARRTMAGGTGAGLTRAGVCGW
jgi:hypothetical protein